VGVQGRAIFADIIVGEFWIAHEKLVKKEIPDWTWGRFCGETGYNVKTPYTWFEKYKLPWTKTGGMAFQKRKEDKPLRSHTKPEVKTQLVVWWVS
jgi:hypothetical protein